jgi:hypothetical protein
MGLATRTRHGHRLPWAQVRAGKFPPARNPYLWGELCGLLRVFSSLILSQSDLCPHHRCHLQIPSNQVTVTHWPRGAQHQVNNRHSEATGWPLSPLFPACPTLILPLAVQQVWLHLASFIAPVPIVKVDQAHGMSHHVSLLLQNQTIHLLVHVKRT